jgi:hypothetical protein
MCACAGYVDRTHKDKGVVAISPKGWEELGP